MSSRLAIAKLPPAATAFLYDRHDGESGVKYPRSICPRFNPSSSCAFSK
jgi:hypothetical protein